MYKRQFSRSDAFRDLQRASRSGAIRRFTLLAIRDSMNPAQYGHSEWRQNYSTVAAVVRPADSVRIRYPWCEICEICGNTMFILWVPSLARWSQHEQYPAVFLQPAGFTLTSKVVTIILRAKNGNMQFTRMTFVTGCGPDSDAKLDFLVLPLSQ